jgi:hypothetical protein
VGVLGVMVMPYHSEHWWGRVDAVTPAISVSFVTASLLYVDIDEWTFDERLVKVKYGESRRMLVGSTITTYQLVRGV